MHHDPKVTCDLCKNEIDDDIPHPFLRVPIPPAMREEMIADAIKMAPIKILGAAIQMNMPSHYSLDICNGCIDGLFPTIKTLVMDQIREIMAKRKKAMESQKRTTPDDDD